MPQSKPETDRHHDRSMDEQWMQQALQLARKALDQNEVPVGAVVIKDGQVIGSGWNHPITSNDPTAHAEIIALREAALSQKNYRLPGTTLYVTLEPCPMCAMAIVHARVDRVVFATDDPRTGAAGSVFDLLKSPSLNHRCVVSAGILKQQCADLLVGFFKSRRMAVNISSS
ncbi:tRNA adenosine(34) deaminase TadA [Pseudomonadota bacterium]